MRPRVNFFGTMGHGLEHFVQQELETQKDLELTVTCTRVGKIFFECLLDSCHSLLTIRILERLFVEVVQEQASFVSQHPSSSVSQFSDYFQVRSLPWLDALKTFYALHSQTGDKSRFDDKTMNPKFRVNCRITGRYRSIVQPRDLAAVIGFHLTTTLHWKVDLREFDLEIFVHLNDDFFVIGLPVTQRPLSDRPYLRHLAVRSTICCAMSSLAKITATDIVLDPMCGAATILIEALVQFGAAAAVGLDADPGQLQKACENRTKTKLDSRLSFYRGDARHLPFLDNTFDVILCDVPFGLKFKTIEKLPKFYAETAPEMNRVLSARGRVVILVSEPATSLFTAQTESFWTLQEKWPVRLGVLPANMLMFTKTLSNTNLS